MLEKSLPITVAPIGGECLTSFLMRTAAVYGVSSERLIRHCLPGQGAKISVPADALTIDPDADILAALAKSLRVSLGDLQAMTLPAHMLSISPGAIAFSGAARDPETLEVTVHTKWLRRAGGINMGGDRFSGIPAFAWCPRCLLVDQLNGHDQFLRLSWRLITRTFCWRHRMPLTTHCLACNDREAGTAFVFNGSNVALACGACGSPHATQLGGCQLWAGVQGETR